MNKGTPILLACAVILAVSCPGVVFCEDPPFQETPTFSNKDLERYQDPKGESLGPVADNAAEKGRTTVKDERREKDYWCSKARASQKKIDRAKDEVKDVERLSSEENGGEAFSESRLKKPTRKKYEKAKKDLREAERDMQYIEEDAHRKDIPPGWLRCQFE